MRGPRKGRPSEVWSEDVDDEVGVVWEWCCEGERCWRRQ